MHNKKQADNLIKQNRILINYKKLTHFENCLLRSREFLKKNFDFIHAQIKASTELSTKAKYNSYTSLSCPSVTKVTSSEPKDKKTPKKASKKKKTAKNQAEPAAENDCKSGEKCSQIEQLSQTSRNVYETPSKKTIPLSNPSPDLSNTHVPRETDTNSASELTSLEFVKYKNAVAASLSILNAKTPKTKCKLKFDHSVVQHQIPSGRQVEFSRGMIEFTLHMRNILSEIDKVHTHLTTKRIHT